METFSGKKLGVIVWMIFCFAAPAHSQDIQFTLNKLVAASSNYLPSLLEKQALVSSAQASVTGIKHSFLPRLFVGDEVSVGTDNSMAGSYLPEIVVPSVSAGVNATQIGQPASGNIASFYSEIPIITFGLHKAEVNNSMSYVNLSKADYDRELYLAKLQVCQLYFSLLQNKYRLSVDSQNISRYSNIFNVIHALTLSGLSPGSDSSLAGAELSSARVSYNQTLGRLNQVKSQLAYYTGVPASKLNIDSLAITANIDTINALQSFDTANNPLLAYYARQQDIYKTNEKLINKSYLPKISLGVGGFARGSSIQYNNDYKALSNGLGYQRFNYIGGIGISYDLFNGVYKRDRLAVNRYQMQASGYALQQQQIALQSTSAQADIAIRTAETNLRELPNQSKAARDVYQQKLAQYKAGLITLIDLTNASFVLYRSQIDFIEAQNDWYTANLLKAEATGNLDSFIQSIK